MQVPMNIRQARILASHGALDEERRLVEDCAMAFRDVALASSLAALLGAFEPVQGAPADLQFEHLVDDFVFGSLALAPAMATSVGYHVHRGASLDDQLDDFSPAGIEASRGLLHDIEARIARLDAKALNAEQRADTGIMRDAIGPSRLDLDEIQSYRHNPTLYVELLGKALYSPFVWHYAPAPERFKHIIQRLARIPQFARQRAEHLT